jgi:ribosomal protein L30E
MQTARQLLRKLASFDPGGALVLSIYLDGRPHTTGENPAVRPAVIVLKDRFREIEKTLLPRGQALDEFRADAARVQHFFDEHAEPWLTGVAIFACDRHQLFEVLETGVPFDDQVALEPLPDLFQLARLIDEQETAVIALVDTNTARLFVTRRGFLEEVAAPDKDPFYYSKRNTGGLNQKRHQRRVENRRMDFAREVATALEELVTHEGATRVILAGDQVAIPLLHKALSPQLEPIVSEQVLSLDIRTPRTEVRDEVAPLLEQIEKDEGHSVTDRLIEAVREQGLGVVGPQETRDALTHGLAETLVLSDEVPLDTQERNELVHLATLSSARVEVVQGHDQLAEAGDVGALLRYRLSWV